MQLRAAGSFSSSGHLRDLVVLIALHVVQHEHGPRSLRQPGDRTLQVHRVEYGCGAYAPLTVLRSALLRSGLSRRFVVHLVSETPPVTSSVAEYQVHCQTVDPARERRLAAKAREPLPDMNEDILCQLDGALSRPAHPQTQRVHPTSVCAIQLLERRLVTPRGAAGELPIGVVTVRDELEARGNLTSMTLLGR